MSGSPRDDRAALKDVARTAWGVARIRARESRRPDRLFDDPYAALFDDDDAAAASAGSAHSADSERDPRRAALAFQVVIRTRFYDEQLLAAVRGGCRQVVLLAAGLDTRAFRLGWPPETTVFELDQPAVLGRKDEVLAAAGATAGCRRLTVGVDLRTDWQRDLLGAGFDASRPAAWLAEGLLVYLDGAAASGLLETVSELSAPGCRLLFERPNPDVTPPDRLRSLFRGGLQADPLAWLRERGWSGDAHLLGDIAAAYGRPISRESRSGFVTATRQASSG